MKNISIILVTFLVGVAAGNSYSEITQTCPGEQEWTLERMESTDAEKAQFCVDLMADPVAPEIVTEYVPQYITVNTPCMECECEPDFEAGRVSGWAEAIAADKMAIDNTKEEYCDLHYCQEKILRNTRPNTGRIK